MKKTLTKLTFFAAFLFAVVSMISGCSKSAPVTPPAIPTVVTTDVVIETADTTARSGGLVTNVDAVVTSYGVCWSTSNQTPTTADTKTADTITNPYYASKITGLKAKTTYYLRAYAINSSGTGYGSVIQFTTGDGTAVNATVSTLAGNAGDGFIDGTADAAFFDNPQGIALSTDGNLYVADSFNSAIRKVTTGGAVTTLAGNGAIGYVDGPIATAQFYAPQSLVTDATGNIFIADLGNNIIRKITPAGVVSTFAGSGNAGYVDGTGAKADFNNPRGLAIDGTGNLYVADRGNNLIRKITPAGVVTTLAGNRAAGQIDGITGTSCEFNRPSGIVLDAAGNLYVADLLNNAIRKITTDGVVTTVIGSQKQPGLVGYPSALSFDTKGDLFIVDQNGRILEIAANKTIYSIAGGAGVTGFADGIGAAAAFSSPQGIAADGSGNVWVADCNNNRIRKVSL